MRQPFPPCTLTTTPVPGTAQNIATGGDPVARAARGTKAERTTLRGTIMALKKRWSPRIKREVKFNARWISIGFLLFFVLWLFD